VPFDPIDDEIRAHLDRKRYDEAFELVIAHFGTKVLRLTNSMLSNHLLAEETAQDVFVRIWRALPSFRGQSAISTWIYAITRNTCLTVLKRRNVHAEATNDTTQEIPAHTQIGNSDRLPDLPRFIAQLPEKYRQVLELFYMEEKSYEEVARLLEMPIGTVKTYLHRAKKALALALRNSGSS
jgi:RNA polymerase sigma-70 factor (ECF subfamily)